METQKEEGNGQIITRTNYPKKYWILMVVGLLINIISLFGWNTPSISYTLGFLIGAFVISRLITYFYYLVVKGKSKEQQHIVQASVFIVLAIIALIRAMN